MKSFWEKVLAFLTLLAGGFGLYQLYKNKKLARKLVKERNARAKEEIADITKTIEERKEKYEKLKFDAGIRSDD
jgi:protein subunit release factor A